MRRSKGQNQGRPSTGRYDKGNQQLIRDPDVVPRMREAAQAKGMVITEAWRRAALAWLEREERKR